MKIFHFSVRTEESERFSDAATVIIISFSLSAFQPVRPAAAAAAVSFRLFLFPASHFYRCPFSGMPRQ